jgi:hypothetical protein
MLRCRYMGWGVVAMLAAMVRLCKPSTTFAQDNWWQYCNARFDQCADIPPNFRSDPPPENGDGLIFRDGRGMVIIVSAMFNALNVSLIEELQERKNEYPEHSYKASGNNWLVLSGADRVTSKVNVIETTSARAYFGAQRSAPHGNEADATAAGDR